LTDDVAGARKFYSELFNWTFATLVATCRGERGATLCGIFHRDRPAIDRKPGRAGLVYLSVTSVEKAQRAVMQGGGRVLAAPRTLPKRGEQAIFADAEARCLA